MGCPKIFHHVKFQIALYSIGFLAGIAALIVFSFVLVVIPAAIFGGFAAIFSGLLTWDIWRNHNLSEGKWLLPVAESKLSLIVKLSLSVLGMTCGAIFFVYYIIKMIYLGQKSGEPAFLSAIQGWMMFKWACAATVHLYRNHDIGHSTPLHDEE